MNICLLLILYIINIQQYICEKDYYKILGISRNSDLRQIKQQFKKMALKYHPDKNQNNIYLAELEFSQIVEAYEILGDSQKRDAYDNFGEFAFNKNKQNNQSEKNSPQNKQITNLRYQNIFSQFFIKLNKDSKRKNVFQNSDVIIFKMEQLSNFLQRNQVWIVLFYNKYQPESLEIIDVYKKFASKYKGIFTVSSINCKNEISLCEDQFEVFYYPKIKAFSAHIESQGQEYKNDMKDIQKIGLFASNLMEDYSQKVTKENYKQLHIQAKRIIALFTEKQYTPILIKAFSKEFKDSLQFIIIHSSEKHLLKKFNVTQFPTIVGLYDVKRYQMTVYKGVKNKEYIRKFLKLQIIINNQHMNINKLLKQQHLANQYNIIIFILIVQDVKQSLMLNNLEDNYPGFDFYYTFYNNINVRLQEDFQYKFPNAIALYKGKYTKYSKKFKLSKHRINHFINHIIEGTAEFNQPFTDDLIFIKQQQYKHDQ
ncbi:hypothetical protein IMG5_173670 [Ichthyophthirius multifiliis]|uniref:J domain-containing protein n=1 Tax=Ichthyophthirius multifiliis TaxID=5932 RepID=G0R1Y6_ICHMU|nr:hypothetical protein IMG5_173670 [Ichthyophthirius multifiliis]EGR28511.1 hypothetical protein IMG5_173670 [Ichthyophthirius multifiliis]|eukprot:XP_004029747.1 hypothetical protein IMG5_173670 [Ichthyophthirius multifiliis]